MYRLLSPKYLLVSDCDTGSLCSDEQPIQAAPLSEHSLQVRLHLTSVSLVYCLFFRRMRLSSALLCVCFAGAVYRCWLLVSSYLDQ